MEVTQRILRLQFMAISNDLTPCVSDITAVIDVSSSHGMKGLGSMPVTFNNIENGSS